MNPQIQETSEKKTMEEPNIESITTITRSLNDVPDDILRHILSLLPTTIDAIQTTFLSQQWRYLCREIPHLHFIQNRFPSSTSPDRTLTSFVQFVNYTLSLRNPKFPILKFHLMLSGNRMITNAVDRWIRFAINSRVAHLELELPKGLNLFSRFAEDNAGDFDDLGILNLLKDLWYCFNFYELCNSSVRVLKLKDCKISLPDDMLENDARFSSLRSLRLHNLDLTSQMVSKLISGCVNLEDLGIFNCKKLKDLKIRSSKLRKLLLRYSMYLGSFEIYAPNLYSLAMDIFETVDYEFNDISSLVEACITCLHYWDFSSILRSLGHVRRLNADNRWFMLMQLENTIPESFILYNLNYLELLIGFSNDELHGMAALLKRCPKLDMLILKKTRYFEQEGLSEDPLNKPIELSIPCLKRVEFRFFEGTENELLILNMLKEQGVEDISVYEPVVDDPSCVPLPQRKSSNSILDYFSC